MSPVRVGFRYVFPSVARDVRNSFLIDSFLWFQVTFFQFVKVSTHSPSSRPVEELIDNSAQFSSSDVGGGFTHVLLNLKPEGSSCGAAHAEIADAGGRFLVDLRQVGSVVTEGMRYQPLAVEPTASVVSDA